MLEWNLLIRPAEIEKLGAAIKSDSSKELRVIEALHTILHAFHTHMQTHVHTNTYT